MIKDLIGHVSDELMCRIPSIKHHYIESENPNHHWHLLQTQDQVVLDLGCGFHLIEPGWETTPEYFINRGAKKIIGVDPECSDIQSFISKYPNHNFYCDSIDSVQKLDDYINNNNITSLKMDIEGYETKFIESKNNYPTLKYIAIETHSRSILNSMIEKLLTLNFNIDTICTFYPRVHHMCNLIYGHR